ncbi:MAG: PmoA family protein [Verrucomicrobia bacterium]|nr:PmoA family protein [Verrucomicrobiota bacterium]
MEAIMTKYTNFSDLARTMADTRATQIADETRQDERTLRFHANHMLDFEITMKATDGDVTFGDDKDGVMAIRLAESMRLTKPRPKGQKKSETGEGHIVMSTGVRDNETWGKRAAWCDYYGPVDGKTVGVAIFDHPGNPRFPTWWHVRDYGLFAANPFGKHHFENLKDDKSAGNFTLANGKSVTFRYRFVFHEGDEAQAKLAEKYAEWAK